MENYVEEVEQETNQQANQAVLQQPTQPSLGKGIFPLKRIIFMAIAVALLISIVGGAYLLGTKRNNILKSSNKQTSTFPTPTPTIDATANWANYSDQYFSLKYPKSWKITTGPNQQKGVLEQLSLRQSQTENDGGVFPNEYEISVQDNKASLSALEFAKNDIFNNFGSNSPPQYSVYPLSNLNAELVSGIISGKGAWGPALYVVNKSIGMQIIAVEQISSEDKYFNQVISSFKFTDETASWKTYIGQGYEIKIPKDYEIKEDRQNNLETFSKVIKKGYDEKYIGVLRKQSVQSDPCNQKPEGYKAECTAINGYRALDWRSNVPPLPMGPLTFIYTFISNGVEYTITFTGIEKDEKDQILSTFKFTQ